MSQAMLDKESWSRALGPTIRVVGYFGAFFVIMFLLLTLLNFLTSVIGFPETIVIFFVTIAPIVIVFFFIWSIFKVLDEEINPNA